MAPDVSTYSTGAKISLQESGYWNSMYRSETDGSAFWGVLYNMNAMARTNSSPTHTKHDRRLCLLCLWNTIDTSWNQDHGHIKDGIESLFTLTMGIKREGGQCFYHVHVPDSAVVPTITPWLPINSANINPTEMQMSSLKVALLTDEVIANTCPRVCSVLEVQLTANRFISEFFYQDIWAYRSFITCVNYCVNYFMNNFVNCNRNSLDNGRY